MKKLLIGIMCIMLACSFMVACEGKKDENPKVTDTQVKDDEPNNGYGDIIDPQN